MTCTLIRSVRFVWRLSAARTLRVSLTLIFTRAGAVAVRRPVPAVVVRRPTFSRLAVTVSTVARAVSRPALFVRANSDSTPLRAALAIRDVFRLSRTDVAGGGGGGGVTVGAAVGEGVGVGRRLLDGGRGTVVAAERVAPGRRASIRQSRVAGIQFPVDADDVGVRHDRRDPVEPRGVVHRAPSLRRRRRAA